MPFAAGGSGPLGYARGKLQLWHGKWPDLSLRTKCLLLISFPAAATVLMFGVANILAARSSADVKLVYRARETSEQIERLRAADAETGASVRAFFITGQDSFVGQARSSLAAFESSQHKLLNLTSDSAAQQQRVAQIASIERENREQVFGDIARFRSGALPVAGLRMALGQTESARRQKANLLTAMELDNARQLEQFLGKVERLRGEQGAITGICLLFGLLGGIAMTLLFARGITSRIASLRANVAQVAGAAFQTVCRGATKSG